MKGVWLRQQDQRLFGHSGFGRSLSLLEGRGQRDVCLWGQVVSQWSDLISVPAVHTCRRWRSAVLTFMKRAICTQTHKNATETRETESEEKEDDREDEEEDDQQGDSDRVRLCGSS